MGTGKEDFSLYLLYLFSFEPCESITYSKDKINKNLKVKCPFHISDILGSTLTHKIYNIYFVLF